MKVTHEKLYIILERPGNTHKESTDTKEEAPNLNSDPNAIGFMW